MDKSVVLSDVGLRDVNPIQYGEEQCSSAKERTHTFREYYLLHYVYAGSGTYQTEEKTYRVEAGQLFITHPFERVYYQPDPADPWQYCWVGFSTALDIPRLQKKHVIDARYAEHIFRSIGATDAEMPGREHAIAGKVMEFLATLIRPDAENGQRTFVDMAVEYLRKNYTRPITIDGLAEQFHVTHSYFSTAFRRQMGMSPYQYLMDLRLERAAELIVDHGYNVSEAAVQVGYNSIYNFSKMFKKKYGVSPSRYAQAK